MNSKSNGTRSPKSEPIPMQRSAFEMSIHLQFRVEQPPKKIAAPKAGDLCPQCQSAKIDYDGLLNLRCPNCGYTLAGCFT
jgi:hypothetical protein